jgi:hypothetical protein
MPSYDFSRFSGHVWRVYASRDPPQRAALYSTAEHGSIGFVKEDEVRPARFRIGGHLAP